MEGFTLWDVFFLLLAIATGVVFISSAMKLTPGRLRKMVRAGGIIIGLMIVGEFFEVVGHHYGVSLDVFEYVGYMMVIAGFLLLAMVAYEASRMNTLVGFRQSAFVRKLRGPKRK